MRMTQPIRDQLDLEAARSRMSVSTMAEHCIREGLLIMALKRRILEEDSARPTAEEYERVMRAVAKGEGPLADMMRNAMAELSQAVAS